MGGLSVFLVILQGVVSLNHGGISGSTLEVTVKPGDNITLYCDCKIPTGVYIMWYRNCSHENQPPLVLELVPDKRTQSIDAWDYLSPLPRFHFVKNQSSGSYDLLIENITDSDEGLYYCGTKEKKVQEDEKIKATTVYRYSNMTTRVHCESTEPYSPVTQDCSVCWMLLFSICPALAALSSFLSSVLVYHLCKKTAGEPKTNGKRPDREEKRREDEDEGVCYAALEIRQTSQRPTKKRSQSSDSTTYSAINTSRK
ncbi:uncharacterized protein LOC121509061 [Cheilinus undulatus]|uniref:uncharacterized protein LOC121509061 n=1 Tax=Cheilinus undulatus TaxID=241271 RepID=UPI001BD5DFE7|nr:uncharacterized protein LOC121509061 [Cheilinus undulatus]XP_041642209.1 uncharacterized protein LOC121509061 [Cheilinus undulatus]